MRRLVTAANVAGVTQVDELLHGSEKVSLPHNGTSHQMAGTVLGPPCYLPSEHLRSCDRHVSARQLDAADLLQAVGIKNRHVVKGPRQVDLAPVLVEGNAVVGVIQRRRLEHFLLLDVVLGQTVEYAEHQVRIFG